MALSQAFGTDAGGSSPGGVSNFHRNDSGRHSYYRVTGNHHKRGKDLAERRLRRYITVAHCSHGNNRPVHTEGYAAKAVLWSLDNIHYRADYNDKREHCEEEHGNLTAACYKSPSEYGCLAHHVGQLQYSKDPEQSENPYHQKILTSGDGKAEVGRKNSEQIDNAIEAEDIAQGTARTENPEGILERKQDCKKPFQVIKNIAVRNAELRDTLKKNHEDAEQDCPEQHNIEPLTSGRISLKNNHVKPTPEAGISRRRRCFIFFHFTQ